MLFADSRKQALALHERAQAKYNMTYSKIIQSLDFLYQERKSSIEQILEVQMLINSIANRPKSFDTVMGGVSAHRNTFRETELYAQENFHVETGVKLGIGMVAGVAVAKGSPSVAMWIATTFGKASTGTAISSLSGVVAKKAALAWLGGGVLTAGGTGVAGGQALLLLGGPVGCGITAVSTVGTVALHGKKNRDQSKKIIEEAKEITLAGAKLNEMRVIVTNFTAKTQITLDALSVLYERLATLKHTDYLTLPEYQQQALGQLVNNTLTMAKMLSTTLENMELADET